MKRFLKYAGLGIGGFIMLFIILAVTATCLDNGDQSAASKSQATANPIVDSNMVPLKFSSVSAGHLYACALGLDGVPTCWGINDNGQGSPPPGERFASIGSGYFHTCALRKDGTPVCWGDNRHGKALPPQNEKFKTISVGGGHTCALRPTGAAVCWGYDGDGQASPPLSERFASISSGFTHTCGLRLDGTAVCWGSSRPTAPMFDTHSKTICAIDFDDVPVCWGSGGQATSPPVGHQFTSITSGDSHTCALRSDGAAVCWGDNDYGQAAPPPNERFTSITSHGRYTCGLLRTDSAIVCWGDDKGIGETPPLDAQFTSINSGGMWFHTCAVRSDGAAVCWVPNYFDSANPSSDFGFWIDDEIAAEGYINIRFADDFVFVAVPRHGGWLLVEIGDCGDSDCPK